MADILAALGRFISFTWWLWLFLIFFPPLRSLWLFWRQTVYKRNINWILLELRMPREVKTTARAMEQVLAALNVLRNTPSGKKDEFWKGEFPMWTSLEMVSLGGEIHFYIRTARMFRSPLEAALFSYYRDVEVVEVEDYADKLPRNMEEVQAREMEVEGTEMLLTKEPAYPIKTYEYFEDEAEEKNLDPMGSFLEILGKVKKGEFAGIQILIQPKSKDWIDAYADTVKNIREGEAGKKKKVPKTMDILKDMWKASQEKPKDEPKFPRMILSPGTTDILKAVESNLSKPAFDTLIRLIYLGPQSTHGENLARTIALSNAFNQYGFLHLNSFRKNGKASTFTTKIWVWPYVFADKRREYRRRRILYNFLRREIPEAQFMGKLITSFVLNPSTHSEFAILSTESLATLFHPPTTPVLTAPHMRRVESRKVGPPAGLAIFGQEEDIEGLK